MDPEKLDIVLSFKGHPKKNGMKIVGCNNIVTWMAECNAILEKLDRIKNDHNLVEFFGVRCESDLDDFRNELIRAYAACKKVLKIPF